MITKKIQGSVVFHIKGTEQKWVVDLKSQEPFCKEGSLENPDLNVEVAEEILVQLMNDSLTPQQAFMKGLLKIKGKMSLAMKLAIVISAAQNEAKPKSKL